MRMLGGLAVLTYCVSMAAFSAEPVEFAQGGDAPGGVLSASLRSRDDGANS